MNVFKYILLFLVFLFTSNFVLAQVEEASQSRSGSFYSLFGVGLPTDNTSPKALGMGIFGVSLDNSQSNTLQNPALWGKNALSTASSGFNLSQFNASNQSSENVNALLEAGYIQVTLPLYREKLGVSASLYSVTRSNYRFVTLDSAVVSSDEVLNYASDIRGAGGISRLEAGLGWSLNKNIAIGYAPSLTFISQNNSQDVFFAQAGYGNNHLDSKITGTAISHRFGALITLRELFRGSDRLSLGASAALPVTIDAEENTTATKVINGQDREVSLNEPVQGSITLPLELKAGVSYYPSSLLNFSFEGLFEQWGSYSSDFSQQQSSSIMSDRYRFGLGAEYHPYRTNSERFFSGFRYSGGLSFDSGHLTIDGKDINTLWFSAGLGIISPRSSSTVDLSIRYGLRGTTSNNLVREKIWALNLSVNLSELMFFRQKLN